MMRFVNTVIGMMRNPRDILRKQKIASELLEQRCMLSIILVILLSAAQSILGVDQVS